ncbi:MAG: hypothetical protein V4864_07595 [Pseudomonadota bacterium]
MDADLDAMTKDELVLEAKRLRAGIRKHRDSQGHELCWHHPDLWALLPERSDPLPVVPIWPEFMRGCVRYRQSLDAQLAQAPRTDAPYEEPRK